MPVEFLTEEQRSRYGAYTTEPSEAQLASYFYLDDTDRERLATKRGSHHRLGFALQVCTVRFLSTFLVDPTRVPSGAVRHIARQLGINDDPAPLLAQYAAWQAREHSREIQHLYGYHDFSEQPQHFRLIRWLYLHAWLTAELPSVLFDLATKHLVDQKVLLAGVSVLERLVASVRDHAANRLWQELARQPTAQQRFRLEDLLKAPEGLFTYWDQLGMWISSAVSPRNGMVFYLVLLFSLSSSLSFFNRYGIDCQVPTNRDSSGASQKWDTIIGHEATEQLLRQERPSLSFVENLPVCLFL